LATQETTTLRVPGDGGVVFGGREEVGGADSGVEVFGICCDFVFGGRISTAPVQEERETAISSNDKKAGPIVLLEFFMRPDP
jgi:hypothetical protein